MNAETNDRAERLAALVRMADAKAAEMSDGQMRSYLDLLADIPTPLLSASCVRLAKAATFGLPTVGDIRTVADEIQLAAAERRALAAAESRPDDEDRRQWVHCQLCQDDDGAWRQMYCPGAGAARDDAAFAREQVLQALHVLPQNCGDLKSHRPHSYVERCACHRAAWREERRKRIEQKFGEDRRDQRRSA
jgi:hypothetical protein